MRSRSTQRRGTITGVSEFEAVRAWFSSRSPRRDAPAGVPQAAVGLLLLPTEFSLELLLIRRAERTDDPWSGHMALPGGRRDDSDESLLETVRREVREEVGVELAHDALLGELDDLRPLTAPARVLVRPFVFGLRARPSLVLSDEVARVRWSSLGLLANSAAETEVFHHGAWRKMPCFRLDDDVVWGMTHRILEPFVRDLGRGEATHADGFAT